MPYKIIEQYLTPNKYSRPQMKLRCIKGIVIHWVANPMSSAKGNRDFFESRKAGTKGSGSAHEVIDLDGDVVLCIPKNEVAYQVGSSQPYKAGSKQIYTPLAWDQLNTNLPRKVKPYPNNCCYGIEATHIDWNGKMTDATLNTLVERTADLCIEFKLDPLHDVYTHQEIVGWKDCHRWFVNNPNEWQAFKLKVKTMMANKLHPKQKVKAPIHKVVEKLMESLSKYFNDVDAKWAVESIDRGKERGIFTVPEDKTFRPNASITREEIAVVIDRTIDFILKNKG